MVNKLLVPITQELAAYCGTHTIITPNERLAKEFRNSHDQYLKGRGLLAWETPTVKSLNQHLRDEFFEQQSGCQEKIDLLTRGEIFIYLFQILQKRHRPLINEAINAIELLHKYQIDSTEYQSISARCKLLVSWYEELQSQAPKNSIFEYRLIEYLRLENAKTKRPIVLYEFEHLSPLETQYLNFFQGKEPIKLFGCGDISEEIPRGVRLEFSHFDSPVHESVVSCQSFNEEIALAARWATRTKKNQPNAAVGIVVPNLTRHYSKVTRQLAISLDPESGSHTQLFNISSGEPIGEQPLWIHASLFLGWFIERLDTEVLAIIANSKFFNLTGLNKVLNDWPLNLRKEVTPKELNLALGDDGLSRAVSSLLIQEAKQTLSAWIKEIISALHAVGWPSTENLESFEYQAHQALIQQLTLLRASKTDLKLPYEDALELIRSSLDLTLHAPERPSSDIQILGLIESQGLDFSHLWVCEMDENNLPSKVIQNPFLPGSLCAAHNVPRANQDAELGFAKSILAQWSRDGQETIFSYTHQKNDSAIKKSPLLRDIKEINQKVEISDWNPELVPQNIELVKTLDNRGSRLSDQEVRGGTALLRDQLNCGFRSFVKNRLGIVEPRIPSNFPHAFERGIVVHEILAKLLSKTYTQAQVMQITNEQIRATTSQIVERNFKRSPPLFREKETDRICSSLLHWIEFEATRAPFKILGLEKPYRVSFGTLEFSIRADRIDETEEGPILIDYKTGKANLSKARASNLKDPQLAIYSLAAKEILGAFYAQIGGDTARFSGIADHLIQIESKPSVVLESWENEKLEWRKQIEAAASDFSQGLAEINPSPDYCQYCHLASLCRID